MKLLYSLLLLCAGSKALCQWTTNTAANLELAALATGDLQTTATSDGKTWVAFYNNVGGAYYMRAQLLDADGNKLLGPDGMLVCSQPSGSAIYVFNICVDAADNLLIAYQYQVSGVLTAVVIKVATDGTLPWGPNGVTFTAGLSPHVAVLSTGEAVVAWNNNSPATLYLQKLSEGGVPQWTTPVTVQVGTTNTTRGQIVPNTAGTFTLVFQRRGVNINTTLYAQRYSAEGSAMWAAPVQLSTLTTSGARYYSVQAEGDTTYVGYYAASGSRFRSYVQRIQPDGALPWGVNGALFSDYATGADPYQQTTNMVKAPGSPYVWAVCTYSNTGQSEYGVFVQKFDRTTGARLLNVYGKEVFPIGTDAPRQEGMLNLAADAPLFMYYNKDYKISATRLDGAGNFVWSGNAVLLSSTTATLAVPKGRFAFRPMVNDKAVAVWTENRGTELRAYAQNVTAGGATGVLPVKLGNFSARRNNSVIDLNWLTFTETVNTGFYAERSGDGVRYASIGFVPTKAVSGNSAAVLNYSLADAQPFEGLNYYRLRQVDANGKAAYSAVATVAFSKGKESWFVYPNPVADALSIASSRTALKGWLSVSNAQGRVVIRKYVDGNTTVSLDVKALPAGRYFINLIDGVQVKALTFVKQ